jgi:acyl-CoA synthetase (AMP-forming)/AMP-acid ligase II
LPNLSIHSLLKSHAERIPDAVAIAAPERLPLKYKVLYDHVINMAETLKQMGIGRNDRVAIVLPNGSEMVTAFLTIAMGATSAPLNPGYHTNEFEFYLTDLNAKALLTQSGLGSPAVDIAKKQGIPVIEISPVLESEAGIFKINGKVPSHPVERRSAKAGDVALVLHTSGTTSRPKIVPLTHTNILTSARNVRSALELVQSDLCLNIMPLFHIHGLIGATLSSLIAGAGIVCSPGFDISRFFGWLEEFRPTWYTAVPTIHQSILDASSQHLETIACCPMRFIRSCSSPLPPTVMVELENVFKVPVIESYGMTEAAHQMTSNPIPPRKRKAYSIGSKFS